MNSDELQILIAALQGVPKCQHCRVRYSTRYAEFRSGVVSDNQYRCDSCVGQCLPVRGSEEPWREVTSRNTPWALTASLFNNRVPGKPLLNVPGHVL